MKFAGANAKSAVEFGISVKKLDTFEENMMQIGIQLGTFLPLAKPRVGNYKARFWRKSDECFKCRSFETIENLLITCQKSEKKAQNS